LTYCRLVDLRPTSAIHPQKVNFSHSPAILGKGNYP
jgi:hypothetical protein